MCCSLNCRVGALKRQLAVQLSHPYQQLRVRAKSGKEAGKIFRDDRTMRANMPSLSDGKEIAVQLLAHAERLGADDMVRFAMAPLLRAVQLARFFTAELCPWLRVLYFNVV